MTQWGMEKLSEDGSGVVDRQGKKKQVSCRYPGETGELAEADEVL